MKIHTEIESAQKLRQRAEAKNQVDMAMTSQPLPATETERFLHELQVHQIELEKQNEQLFHTQSELERKILELEDTIKSLNERNEQIRRLDLQQLLIFEASPLGMALVVDRTAIMVNRSFCAMTGYDIDDLIGKSTRINYRSQEDFEQFGAMAYPLLAAGKIVHGASVFRRKNGTCMDVSITGGLCDVNDSAGGTIWMIEDITRNKKEAAVLEARLRLMQCADHNTLQELLRATLDEVESLTGSQIGFFHFVEPDEITLSLQAWSTNTRQGMCQTVPTEGHYPVSKAGVWSECVTTRQPAIHNDYVSLPHRKGLPDGHAPIIRELVVPILRGNKIVALLGVGNKESEYDQLDVDTASRLADLAWDIAEKKRTDDERTEIHNALQIKEERLENVIRATDAGTWEWNILTGEVINERIVELLGYTMAELAPVTIDTWYNFAHPVDLKRGRKLLYSHFKDPSSPYDPEMRMKHKNGHWIWIRNRGSVTSWTEDGRALIMHGTFIDITARKQSEVEMHKLARAVEQASVSIIITDKDQSVEFVNPMYCEITGYTAEEILGNKPGMIKSGETAPQTYKKLWTAISSGETWEGEFVNKRKDGSLLYERAIISALRDENGEITHYLAVKEDVTEKKSIMEQLIQS